MTLDTQLSLDVGLMKIDVNVPEFTQAEVVRVTGVAEKTMQNWASRGVLQLTEQNPGRARRRLYSAADVFMVAIMLPLVELGVGATDASRYAKEILRSRFGDLRHQEHGSESAHDRLTDIQDTSVGEVAVIYPTGMGSGMRLLQHSAEKPAQRFGEFATEVWVYYDQIILDAAQKLEKVKNEPAHFLREYYPRQRWRRDPTRK